VVVDDLKDLELSLMNVLAFFAHPDDETILAGGILALLANSGAKVHYLVATRGEGGEMGEPPLCSQEELGEVREKELSCAVQTLNGWSLSLLDYVDPVVQGDQLYAYTEDLEKLSTEVYEVIHSRDIDVLISHGTNGEYGHPAHVITNQAATASIKKYLASHPDKPIYFYTAASSFNGNPKPRLANQDDPAHIILDVYPVLGQKIAAAMCHRTQHALFVRRKSEELGRKLTVPEVIVHLESLHRVYPPVDGPLDDPLFKLIEKWEWKQPSL